MSVEVKYKSHQLALFLAAPLFALQGCSEQMDAVPGNVFLQQDQSLRSAYQNTTVTVYGEVVDSAGSAIEGAKISAFDQEAYSDVSGAFRLQGLPRRNVMITVEKGGSHTLQWPLQLQREASQATIQLEALTLTEVAANETRFMFGGDVSFARRFLDPQELTPSNRIPPNNPSALIQAGDPLVGSRQALDYIRSTLEQADFPVINFESPVTLNPATPHPTKDFVYFTLPESLEALTEVGINYVSLGNNHVYDYLEAGLQDTLSYLQQYQINYSGAGITPEAAFLPYETVINGLPVSFVSANSISGFRHEQLYVATNCVDVIYNPDACVSQGGAADLNDDTRLSSTISMAKDDGNYVIAQLHTGTEYTLSPSSYAYKRMTLAVEAGADLVISHHPHTAQGFRYHNDVLIFEGLGNFLFDQDRHDTMLGLLAQIDIDNQQVIRARGIPVYLKDYRPRRISGALANRFIRRLSESSRGEGSLSFPYQNTAWVFPEGALHTKRTAQLTHTVTIDQSGVGVVDLRHLIPSEASLSKVSSSEDGLSLAIGRDILLYGDFEDYDIDDQQFEAARWDVTGSDRFACMSGAYKGVQGLCMVRDAQSAGDTVAAFRNRIRVMGDGENTPNKNLSLFGYVSAKNSGPLNIVSRYYASFGEEVFGEESAYSHPGGDFSWQTLFSDLSMPEDLPEYAEQQMLNPRALRIFLRHSPTEYGGGMAAFDELAVINWYELQSLDGELAFETPHAQDFLRVEAAPGSYTLTLDYDIHLPE